MKGELPDELRKPSARFWWELQHPCLPELLKPWSPLWVTGAFLDAAQCLPDGSVRWGQVTVGALVVDCLYLDASVLQGLARLSSEGARVILTNRPREPGRKKRRDYSDLVDSLSRGTRTSFSSDPGLLCAKCRPFFSARRRPTSLFASAMGDFRCSPRILRLAGSPIRWRMAPRRTPPRKRGGPIPRRPRPRDRVHPAVRPARLPSSASGTGGLRSRAGGLRSPKQVRGTRGAFMDNRDTMRRFQEGRFGAFIHYGLYSISAAANGLCTTRASRTVSTAP